MNVFESAQVDSVFVGLMSEFPVFQVITGPRQIGKTTAAKQIVERFPYESVHASADFPLPADVDWFEGQWRLAGQKVAASGRPVLLFG